MNIQWIYTSRDSQVRWQKTELFPTAAPVAELSVFPEKKKQKIYGFGGAFTDTSAMALKNIHPALQKEALDAYFDKDTGLCYNMGRVPIGACDFSSVAYSHAEVPGDTHLKHYSIQQDQQGILPLIKKAKKYLESAGEALLLYALPWSPPGWMKSNGQANWGGKLLPQYYQTMADYLIRFIKSYEEEGVSIWGIAPQNEPVEIQRWASCEYSSEEEKLFIKNFLIPTLKKNGYENKKILFWDCNKDQIWERAFGVLSDQEIYPQIFGAAFHWYSGDFFEELEKTHQYFPQTKLLATECCVVMPDDLNDWSVGERYAHDMIGNFNHWTCGWIDWNLFLNQNSGPGISDNPCAAPLILDSQNQKIIYMSSYYYIGHFSRYIRRDAKALQIASRPSSDTELPEFCAFCNPDGTLICIFLNRTEQAFDGSVSFGSFTVPVKLGAHSIGTMILNNYPS